MTRYLPGYAVFFLLTALRVRTGTAAVYACVFDAVFGLGKKEETQSDGRNWLKFFVSRSVFLGAVLGISETLSAEGIVDEFPAYCLTAVFLLLCRKRLRFFQKKTSENERFLPARIEKPRRMW